MEKEKIPCGPIFNIKEAVENPQVDARNMIVKAYHKVIGDFKLAGNPINYSKVNKLTTVEALAGAVYILGESELMHTLLQKFKWGPTFFALNENLLEEYSKAKSESEILEIIHEYGLTDAQFT